MRNNPVTGAGYVLRGLDLIRQPGLRRFVIMPLLVNLVVFTLVGWYALEGFESLLDWMLPAWLDFLRWILWPVFALTALLVVFYTFTVIANLIAAPFNGILAAQIENRLAGTRLGTTGSDDTGSLVRDALSALTSELRKQAYFLIRAIPLLILFIIPAVNTVAPILWILFSAWFLALEYADYPMGNHGIGFREQYRRLKPRRLLALGFGGGVTLLMMIPILNFFTMPAAVAGATALWWDHLRDETASSA